MRLIDFLQMSKDLDSSYSLTFKPQAKKAMYPILKISLEADKCVLLSQTSTTKCLSLAKLFSLVKNTHNRGIPLVISLNGESFPVFGLQINPKQKIISLM